MFPLGADARIGQTSQKSPAFDEVYMPFIDRRSYKFLTTLCACLVIWISGGCGFNRLEQATLPAQVAGFSLADLDAILRNTALTEMEQREAIRAAIGAPDNDSGDRLVNFLFNFNVP